MSDTTPDPTNEAAGDAGGDSLADLRRAADEGAKAKRENVLLRAGVDLDSPLGELFARGYDGEWTPEAVKAAWGQIAPAPSTPTPAPAPADAGPSPEELARQAEEQRQQDEARRAIGSTPPEPQPDAGGDPVDRGWSEYHERIAAGETQDKAAPAVTHALIADAVNGGERDWSGWSEEQLAGDAPIVPPRPAVRR